MATKLAENGIVFPDGSVQTAAAYDTFKNAQTFTTSGTWTAPTGIYLVQLTMFGGGGRGGAGSTYTVGGTTFYSGGGGGGSSAVVWNYRVAVVPGTVYTVTVGATTVASSFGALVSVNPGITGNNASGSTAGTGGSGGSALDVSSQLITTTVARTTTPQSFAGNAGGNGSNSSNNGAAIGGTGATTPFYNYAGASPNGGSASANTGAGGAGANYTGAVGQGGSGLVIVQW